MACLFVFSVPKMAPVIIFGYNTSTSSLNLSWNSIPPTFNITRGILLGYKINLTSIDDPENPVLIKTDIDELSKEVAGLAAHTTYCARVAGRTRVGPGKWSDCHFVTTDDAGGILHL